MTAQHMLNEELVTLLPRFVDKRGPSHDEISRVVMRAGLSDAEPDGPDGVQGKVKRMRNILAHALDRQPAAGQRFVELFIEQVRACGGFRAGMPNYPGSETIAQLRKAFRRVGFNLDPEGTLRPTVLENLDGVEMTEALSAYVRRAQLGSRDAELLIGTAKNLEEATVRHVLKETTGEYATVGRLAHFPKSLFDAYYALNLAGSDADLDKNPYRALQQALFLLACAVNRLRNDRGDGHGRPEPSVATALEGRLSTQSAGLVCELLLTVLKTRQSLGDSADGSPSGR